MNLAPYVSFLLPFHHRFISACFFSLSSPFVLGLCPAFLRMAALRSKGLCEGTAALKGYETLLLQDPSLAGFKTSGLHCLYDWHKPGLLAALLQKVNSQSLELAYNVLDVSCRRHRGLRTRFHIATDDNVPVAVEKKPGKYATVDNH